MRFYALETPQPDIDEPLETVTLGVIGSTPDMLRYNIQQEVSVEEAREYAHKILRACSTVETDQYHNQMVLDQFKTPPVAPPPPASFYKED